MSEIIKKYVSSDLRIRLAVTVNTNLIRHLQDIQQTQPIPTIALGRAITGALLMASNLKSGHKLGLHFKGDGPLSSVFAEASFHGVCRGCTGNPHLSQHNGQPILSVGSALGQGQLMVAHNQQDKAGRYQGVVDFSTGEIGDDIAFFLHQSQQVRSVVSLGVFLNQQLQVSGAGGIIIELMPDANGKHIEILEQNASQRDSLSEMIANGATADDIANHYLRGIDISDLAVDKAIRMECPCSKERIIRSLQQIDPEYFETIKAGIAEPQITCEFCGKIYSINKNSLTPSGSQL